jgi:hypothetical protein
MSTVVVENEKIRITLSKELFDQFQCEDRIEYLKSGDKIVHSGASEQRGKVLSYAMSKLANDQEYLRVKDTPKITEPDYAMAELAVKEKYKIKYLLEHNHLYGDELWVRLNGGHRLSSGMAQLVEEANAYATGIMGDCDLHCFAERCLNISKYEKKRELNKLALMSPENQLNVDEEIVLEAHNLMWLMNYHIDVEISYRNRFKDWDMRIEILRPDLMPNQIGTCAFDC